MACLAAGSASAQTAEPKALGLTSAAPLMRWDPAVRFGRLPNGLRYAVQHTDTPKGAVSLRLGVAVGSYDEADDELGAAHLVEHLAFEATRSFGDNQAALTFAPIRMAFGPDRNAQSDLGQTVYQLDLPTPDPLMLAAAGRWLRDVADGLAFTEVGVGRQRAAMAAERGGRASLLAQLREQVSAFEDGGLRSAARPILGRAEGDANLTPARLKAFYDRWYRPANAVVVITGDLPLDEMEKQVRAAFGDWSAGAAATRATPAPVPAGKGLEVLARSAPGTSAVARICRIAPPDPEAAPPPARLRTLLTREVWRAILQRRLNVLATRADAPFSQTNVSTDVRPDSLKTCIAIAPAKGGEVGATRLVQTEFQRFVAEGPSGREIDLALEQLRAIIRGAIGGAPKSTVQAGEILQRAMDSMPQLAPREGLRAFDILLEDLQEPAVQAQFARDWAGRGPLVTVVGPDAVAEPAIRAAMDAPLPVRPPPKAAAAAAGDAGPRPSDEQARLARAEQLLRDGKAKDARGAFDDLIRRDPRDVAALAGRGRAQVALGKIDAALKDYATALAVQPDSGLVLNARGNLYVAMNKAELAVPDFDKALGANPDDDVVLYNRGLALKQMGRHDAALRDFNHVLRLTPNDPLTLTGKADAYRQLGDLLLAREFYDAALAADPNSAVAFKGRGEVREGLGDAAGGAADKARARSLDPSVGGG